MTGKFSEKCKQEAVIHFLGKNCFPEIICSTKHLSLTKYKVSLKVQSESRITENSRANCNYTWILDTLELWQIF